MHYDQIRQERLILERLEEARKNPRRRVIKSELAAEAEVSERTIQRAMERLQNEHNMPIIWNASRRSYELTEPLKEVPVMYMRPGELYVLFVSSLIVEQFRNTGMYDKLVAAMDKLIKQFGTDKLQVSLGTLQEALRVRPDPPRAIDPDIFEDALMAVEKQLELEIMYAKPGAAAAKRVVHPYRIIAYYGDWYIAAWCTRQKDIRLFAVSRIKKLKERGAFTYDESVRKSIDEWLAENYGIFRGEKKQTVKLRFSESQAPYIRERVWHEGQKIVENPNGTVELSFTTTHFFEVIRWVLSFGADVEVLAPAALREQVCAAHKAALRQYQA